MLPAVPLPYRDVFSDFPEVSRPRNRDLKTTHNAFRSCRMHFCANANSCRPSVQTKTKQYSISVDGYFRKRSLCPPLKDRGVYVVYN